MLRYSTKALLLLPLVAVGWHQGSALADEPADSVAERSVTPQFRLGDSAAPSSDQELQATPNPNASLLDDQQEMTRLLTEKLRNQVSHSIEAARESDDPAFGLSALKQTLGSVKSAIDIGPEDRLRMQKQLESAIQQQEVKQDQLEQQLTRALERRAQQEAQARLSEQAILDEERLENLIDRVRS
ncbi:MAG TPA: hypothetical protein VGM98_09475, partial [Schlesneria sp.]